MSRTKAANTSRVRSGTVPTRPAPAHAAAPAPHPPPAGSGYVGLHGGKPLGGTTCAAMSARLPSALRRTAQTAWGTDRLAVPLLLGCRLPTGLPTAVLLPCTAGNVRHRFGTGPVLLTLSRDR